jgi:hypothetical protein
VILSSKISTSICSTLTSNDTNIYSDNVDASDNSGKIMATSSKVGEGGKKVK